ncbi:MAG: hypothetical protein OEL83_04500 [Desulforhopalus sp.]|nr:hypothetical protein [Desulforhopalus sp.]
MCGKRGDITPELSRADMDNKYISYLFEGKLTGTPLDEILSLAKNVSHGADLQLIREVHNDLAAFFGGAHPDFQKNTLPYHNLRHSQMVVLATIRLFDGLHCNSVPITADMLLRGLLAAYFHDTGMLLVEGDTAHSGTEYLANHEERSILFLKRYAARKGLSDDIAEDCTTIIKYTDLNSDPSTFEFHSRDIQLIGQIVGSADILAQMADRYYLECLPLLYNELHAGGVSEHGSALELMEHTANFYHNVVLKRLLTTFSHTSEAMQTHFRERHGIDRNLYIENIDKNVAYLKKIIKKCRDINCLHKYLKRIPPTI